MHSGVVIALELFLMSMFRATARACSNIALVKYWGNRDEALRLPANPSVSFNLRELFTTTAIEFDPALQHDLVCIDGMRASADAHRRVGVFLDLVRNDDKSTNNRTMFASVVSHNNFPMGTGIASSASAFAALGVAACEALHLHKTEAGLSALARHGSGSASRSIPGGFVAWRDEAAASIAPAEHWPLVDVIGIVSAREKRTGSTEGHALAPSSPLQAARVADAPRRFANCLAAIAQRDFAALADVIEQDALMMHSVMMTSVPPLLYLLPASLAIIHEVQAMRARGTPVAFTIDAGPNIHCICELRAASAVAHALGEIAGVERVLNSGVGGAASVIACSD